MSTIKTIVQIGDIYISLVGERYGDPSTTEISRVHKFLSTGRDAVKKYYITINIFTTYFNGRG